MMRGLRLAGLGLVMMAFCGGAAAAARLGPATVLLSDAQRHALGLQFGPDAPVALFQGADGQFYLNTTAGLQGVTGPGKQQTIDLHVDQAVTRILALHGDTPASGSQDVQSVLSNDAAQCGWGQARAASRACDALFDRDYAGGGELYRCGNGTVLYFYHGENHTASDGSRYGEGGWFGIGLGVMNASQTHVTRLGQIAGIDLPASGALAPGRPPQAHPFNNMPNVSRHEDGYLYLVHGNATLNPEYYPRLCGPECLSLSRAPERAVCDAAAKGALAPWQNWYHGAYGPPALLPDGAGGKFTPIISDPLGGEHGGAVTWLPTPHRYALVMLQHGGITLRMSPDEANWSAPVTLLAAPDATPLGDPAALIYARILVTHQAGAENYVLTYVEVTKGHFWKWAALMRADLTF